MQDVIIIGAGPAGLAAAVYVQRAGRKALILEKGLYGGQIINTPQVENYPAVANISGYDFANNLYQQAADLGAEVKKEQVIAVDFEAVTKEVVTQEEVYRAKAVIIATGAKKKKLGISGEEKFAGAGVSYCATCDGMFYKGRDVAVVGGGNTALEDALFLTNYCKTVYMIHRRDSFRGEQKLQNALRQCENVEFVMDSQLVELCGDDRLSGVRIRNNHSGEERILSVQGIFAAIGQEPECSLFADILEMDEKGYIQAAEDCRTSREGVFVAGDCRTKEVRQLTTATADGAVAALAACGYLDTIDRD